MKKLLWLIILIGCYAESNAQIITTVAGNGKTGFSGDGGKGYRCSIKLTL